MKRQITFILVIISIVFVGLLNAKAQDPARFKDAITQLENKEYNFDTNKKLIVFAGSSSIGKWTDVAASFPLYNVINNGFGGSHFSDLIYYYNQLILKPEPDYLFIYEGDNDIAGDKNPGKIYKEAKGLIKKIKADLPKTRIIIISPKPSIARWELHKKYETLNKKLNKFCKKHDNVEFADVWNAMLDENGKVFQDIFIEDGLHMNKKGYDIWEKVLKKLID